MIDQSPLSFPPTIDFLDKTSTRMAYGCWRMAEQAETTVRSKLDAALECGIHILDTAAIYGFGDDTLPDNGFGHAETMLGNVLSESVGLRDEFQIVTKGGITPPLPYNSSPDHLVESCEASLKRLRTDHVELFLVHRPDYLSHPADVAAALSHLIESGKTRSVGVSNYTANQFAALQDMMDYPLIATQPEFSAYENTALDNGVLDQAMAIDTMVMAWSPLAGGALATGLPPETANVHFDELFKELSAQADANGVTPDIIALAWILAHPARTVPLLGTQSPDRIRSAMKAFTVQMTRQKWYSILEKARGAPMP